MKMVLAAVFVLFSATSVFAAPECSSFGGTCKYNCGPSDFKKEGYFRDCDYKMSCCLTAEQQKENEEQKAVAPKTRKPVARTGKTTGNTTATGKGEEALSGPANEILVCTPVNEAFAKADTPLQCGSRTTTLDTLYKENYRLIQMLNSPHVVYYMERNNLR